MRSSYLANAGYPVRRGLSIFHNRLRDTGSPALAGDDRVECGCALLRRTLRLLRRILSANLNPRIFQQHPCRFLGRARHRGIVAHQILRDRTVDQQRELRRKTFRVGDVEFVRQLYVIVNSKMGPEFEMPSRSIPAVLGRSIAVALTSALRAEITLVYVGAQRHKIELHIAHVDPTFSHPIRGVFDGKYMQALYDVGVAAGKKGTAFEDALPAGGSR